VARGCVLSRAAATGPVALHDIDRWVGTDLATGCPLLAADDRTLRDRWFARWADRVDVEVVPVIRSDEAAASVT
jgi:hypothetical protein